MYKTLNYFNSEDNCFHKVCPICSNNVFRQLINYSKHHLVRCSYCGFVFSRSIPSLEELNKLYNSYSYEGDNLNISPITIKRYEELLNKMEYYRKYNRILDVGCGTGLFLLVAQKMGWECYGTEFSEAAVSRCKKNSLHRIYKGTLNDVKDLIPIVDVIVSIEVLEHIPFPANEIKLFYQILRPNGLLYITTPNFNSLSRYLLKSKYSNICYPEHLNYFTYKTLTKLLEMNGFKILNSQISGFSVDKISKAVLKPNNNFGMNKDEKLRSITEINFFMKLTKNFLNYFLNFTRTGDTIKVWAMKI